MKRVHSNLWRGPRPTDLREMKRLGFKRVISLQSGVEDRWTNTLAEQQRRQAKDFGIDYIYVRCRNWLPPTAAQVSRVMLLLKWFNIKTYIHCHSGVDRTGFMCAVYRMSAEQWPFAAAYQEWKAEGRHWWFWWWKPFLKRWAP